MKHPLFCFFCFFLWLGCCWGTDYCLLSVPNEGVITGHSGVVASKSGEIFVYNFCQSVTSPQTLPFANRSAIVGLGEVGGCRGSASVCQQSKTQSWITVGKHKGIIIPSLGTNALHLLYVDGAFGCQYTQRISIFLLYCFPEFSPPEVIEEEPCTYVFRMRSPLYCPRHSQGLGNTPCLFPIADRWINLRRFIRTFSDSSWKIYLSFCAPLMTSLATPKLPRGCRGSHLCLEQNGRGHSLGKKMSFQRGKIVFTEGRDCTNGGKHAATLFIRCGKEDRFKRNATSPIPCHEMLLLTSPVFCPPEAQTLITPSHSRFRKAVQKSTYLGRVVGGKSGGLNQILAKLEKMNEEMGKEREKKEDEEEEYEDEEDEEERERREEVEGDMVGSSVDPIDEGDEESKEEKKETEERKEMVVEDKNDVKWGGDENTNRYFYFPGVVYENKGAWDATTTRSNPIKRTKREGGALAPKVRKKLRQKVPLSSLGSGMIGPGAPKRGTLPLRTRQATSLKTA